MTAEKPLTLRDRSGAANYSPMEWVESGAGQIEGVDTNEVLNWVEASTQTAAVTLPARTLSLTLREKST